MKTKAKLRRYPNKFYWLSVNKDDENTAKVDVSLDKAGNSIVVTEMGKKLDVWLNSKMLDLSKLITIKKGEVKKQVTAKVDMKKLISTLLERGDPNFMFESRISLEYE